MTKRNLIISDLHIPDHNVKALGLIYRFIKTYKPTTLHILGDFINFPTLSAWPQDPHYHITLSEEINEARQILVKLCKIRPNMEVLWYEGNHECFDEHTEILTNNGWLHYSKINKDTELVTFDKEKDCLEIEKPIAIQVYDYDGEMYEIKNRSTNLLITPNHRLYFKYNQTSKWQTKEINQMTIGDNRVYFRTSGTFNQVEYPITDDELRISAWLFTDGFMSRYVVSFYQRKSKVYMIEEILNRLGWKFNRHERYREIQSIQGKDILSHEIEVKLSLLQPYRAILQSIVKDKHTLSDWVYKLSDRQFDVFLNSFIDGDGSRHKSAPLTSLMVYGRKKIIEELQRACFIHGYRTSISEYRPEDFRLNINKSNICTFDRFKEGVKKLKYRGIIWDVTTPNDTVIVRRKGKISITGNSRMQKYLARNAAQLASLEIEGEQVVSIPHLFKLRELCVKYTEKEFRDGVLYHHGQLCRAKSGYTAHGNMEKTGVSVLSGHVHRVALVFKNLYDKQIFGMETGCLCNQKPYPYYGTMVKDWSLGWATIDVIDNNVFPRIYPIINGKI